MTFGITFGFGLASATVSVVFLAAGGFLLGILLAIAAAVLLIAAYRHANLS